MRKIGLFGGSFDPIHKGHIEIAKHAIEQLQLDEVQFIPTKNNPWKNQSCAKAKERLHMIHIAIEGYPKLSVNTIELENKSDEKNYTIDTLKKITKKNPDIQYYYIMGMDQANSFHQWKKSEKISQLVQLVAFQRGGYNPDDEVLKQYHFITLDNEPVYASSSEIRQGHIEMLDPKVLHYISNHGLYLETMIMPYMKEKRWKHTCSVAKLAKDIAKANHLNTKQAYIAGMMHDIAKEMDEKEAYQIMKEHFPEFISKPVPIWHQWLSRYVCEHEFLIDNPVILKAIEDHTTASIHISPIGKCLYVADKLDPLRGYDSSKQIEICKKNIDKGFRDALIDFYQFSKKKNREIDECFYEIYDYYVVKGEK